VLPPPGSTVAAGPLTEHERYFFDLNGYVVRRGVLNRNEVEALNTAIDVLGLAHPAADLRSQRFDGFLTGPRCFRDLIDHPGVFDAVVDLCGPYVRLDHAYGLTMLPGTSGIGLHGGGTPRDPAQDYDAHDGTMYNGLVALQWALVDHGPGDGGFGCIPASHKAKFPVPTPVPKEWIEEVTLAAGDVVMFSEALTHCTLPWNALVTRRALFYKYAPGHLAWGTNYLSDLRELALSGMLTERQRILMDPPSVAHRTDLRTVAGAR
jgi:hypothetical protein